MHTAQDFHECALAGTIFAQETMDLAGEQIEIDTAERTGTAEALDDTSQDQDWLMGIGCRCARKALGTCTRRDVREVGSDCFAVLIAEPIGLIRHDGLSRFASIRDLVLEVVTQPDIAWGIVDRDRTTIGPDEVRDRVGGIVCLGDRQVAGPDRATVNAARGVDD